MTDPPPSPLQSALTTVTALLAVIGGLAGLVAVLGGVALTLRLWWRGLPTESIAGGLPTSLFLSLGIDATLQLLIFAGLIALASLRHDSNWPVVLVLAGLFTLLYPFLRIFEDGALVLVIGLALLAALVGWGLVAKFHDNRRWIGAAVLVVFFAFRIPFELFASEVTEVKACTLSGNATQGLFVGETDSKVFIGLTEGDPQIAEIPADQIYRLFLGKEVSAKCPPAPAS